MCLSKRNNLKKILISISSGNSGAVAVIIGICIFALMIATALAVDVGSLFEDKRHLQTVADSAALAGAQELPEDKGEAINKATEYVSNNYNENVDINIEIEPFLGAADASITVTVFNPDSPLYFARVMGKESTPVGAAATAIVASPRGVGNVVPWGLEKKYFDEWVPGGEYPLKFQTQQEPGNYLALDLDGLHGGGSIEYTGRIVNGYEDLLSIGDLILTETGNKARTVVATEERIEIIGDGWQDFLEITNPCEGGYELVGSDTQFVVVPLISIEGLVGQSEPVVIEGFVTMVVTSIIGNSPGKSEIWATFVNRALIITEGSPLDPVGSSGLRVIRLIR